MSYAENSGGLTNREAANRRSQGKKEIRQAVICYGLRERYRLLGMMRGKHCSVGRSGFRVRVKGQIRNAEQNERHKDGGGGERDKNQYEGLGRRGETGTHARAYTFPLTLSHSHTLTLTYIHIHSHNYDYNWEYVNVLLNQ